MQGYLPDSNCLRTWVDLRQDGWWNRPSFSFLDKHDSYVKAFRKKPWWLGSIDLEDWMLEATSYDRPFEDPKARLRRPGDERESQYLVVDDAGVAWVGTWIRYLGRLSVWGSDIGPMA